MGAFGDSERASVCSLIPHRPCIATATTGEEPTNPELPSSLARPSKGHSPQHGQWGCYCSSELPPAPRHTERLYFALFTHNVSNTSSSPLDCLVCGLITGPLLSPRSPPLFLRIHNGLAQRLAGFRANLLKGWVRLQEGGHAGHTQPHTVWTQKPFTRTPKKAVLTGRTSESSRPHQKTHPNPHARNKECYHENSPQRKAESQELVRRPSGVWDV